MSKIKAGDIYDINDNILQSELIKYLIESQKDQSIIDIGEEQKDFFLLIYNGEVENEIDFKFKKYKKRCKKTIKPKYVDEIVVLHNNLCYFGMDEKLEYLYKKIHELFLHIERKKIEMFFESIIDCIDVQKLCSIDNPNISRNFINKYRYLLSDSDLCRIKVFDEKFLTRRIKTIDWLSLSVNPNISEEFFEKHLHKVSWRYLCLNTNISEEFFERYIHLVCFKSLCQNTNISEEFFERHLDKVDWRMISTNPNMSEEFFERYLDKVNWYHLSLMMNETFIEKHLDRVIWLMVSQNPNMSEEFFVRHIDKVYIEGVFRRKNVSENFIFDYWHRRDYDCWRDISCNPNLSKEFIEAHIDDVCWASISEYSELDSSFFEKHLDKIKWEEISGNDNLDLDFIKKYIEKIDKHMILYNNFEKRIRKNLDSLQVFKFDKQWKKHIKK